MQGVTKNEQNHQHHHNIVIEKFDSFEILPGTIDSDVSLTCRQGCAVQCFGRGELLQDESMLCSRVVFLTRELQHDESMTHTSLFAIFAPAFSTSRFNFFLEPCRVAILMFHPIRIG